MELRILLKDISQNVPAAFIMKLNSDQGLLNSKNYHKSCPFLNCALISKSSETMQDLFIYLSKI